MVHVIVDKHMNKINTYSAISKGYRVAMQPDKRMSSLDEMNGIKI